MTSPLTDNARRVIDGRNIAHLATLQPDGAPKCDPVWVGREADRLVVVRSGDVVTWGRVVATLLSGVRGVYAEIPNGVREAMLRTLVAKARSHRTTLVLRPVTGALPAGIAHLRLEAKEVSWEGTDAGHGQLLRRRTVLEASGKWAKGIHRTIEVEDDGTNDLRVVPHLGIAATRRLA